MAQSLDLRGTPCPLNFIRTRLALEKLPASEQLQVLLDGGEPDQLVGESLQGEGEAAALVSALERSEQPDGSVQFIITRA